MKKRAFKGTIKFTPQFAKCDPILITGDWSYNEERKAWICNNAIPRCYNGMGFAEKSCEIISEERQKENELQH